MDEIESFLLPVRELVTETDEAYTVVLDVPDELREHFRYKPGQFLTVAVPSSETGLAARCYSLSSSPVEDGPLRITVKRTPEGYASHWIGDNVKPGHRLRVLPPAGIFTPKDLDDDFLLLTAGSGVTPMLSITRSALAQGTGKVVVFYANRDAASIIFAEEWERLQAEHPDRLTVVHWLEDERGLPTQDDIRDFAAEYPTYDAFCCGPTPFMKMVSLALRELGFPRERRHQEKFVSLGGNPFGDGVEPIETDYEVGSYDRDGA
jgi:3-ketosteroid 9alpha-monooxygenase subunit B